MKSNFAILEANNAVPLTKSASYGARNSWSSYCAVEIEKVRRQAKLDRARKATIAYQEAINAATHDLFAGKMSHAAYKRRVKNLKKRFAAESAPK